jgi:protein gp37
VSKTIYDYATKSWPIVKGCDPKMPCAERCWARRECHRLAANPNPKIAAFHRGLTNAYGEWTGRVKLNMDHLTDPSRWKKPQRVAVAYHGDLFRAEENEVAKVFMVMDYRCRHEFLVLTKCAKEARDFLLSQYDYGDAWSKNLRVGFSASDQAEFDARWVHMRELAVAGWFVWVSLEPLIGPVDISAALKQGLRWVVVGGESGPGARPMHPDWARGIRDQCRAAKVPFWFKQHGEWAPWRESTRVVGKVPQIVVVLVSGSVVTKEENFREAISEGGVLMARVGTRVAGCLLDGREWKDFPGGAK